MPVNRNSLLRYKTIDRMLKGGHEATLEDLIYACNDALYDYNGCGEVSRRTIQNDIREMRYSQALGYYAPIEVVGRKFYTYSDPDYSIMKMPITEDDLIQLSEAVDIVKQMSSFQGFSGVADVVNRLEDYVSSMRHKVEPVIMLESNDKLRGLEHITPLHDAIMVKEVLTISYKPFTNDETMTFFFSPYILKEFRNRWFVFGKRHDSIDLPIINLALDRIEKIDKAPKKEKYITEELFEPKTFFNDMIGVSRDIDSKLEHITFEITQQEAPYVLTKPLHSSQKVKQRLENGNIVFSLDVIVNYELIRDLMGLGESITVLSPDYLVEKIKEKLTKNLERYQKK